MTRDEILDVFTKKQTGWVHETGITLLEASGERVVANVAVTEKHHQGYGIVHGGVHCSIVEAMASLGAALAVCPDGAVVGLDNHTSFVRAVRGGTLHAVATPLQSGRRSQLWQVDLSNDAGQLVSTGRVRFHVLRNEDMLAGEKPSLHPPLEPPGGFKGGQK